MAESFGFSTGSSVFEDRRGPVTCSACVCRLREEPGDVEARWFHFSPLGGRDARGCSVASGRNTFFADYWQFLKQSEIPEPAKLFITLDEHPDSINDGYFLNNPDPETVQWGDTPASYHNGACGFSFADGHSEIHKWNSRTAIYPVRFQYAPLPLDAAGRQDYLWHVERLAVRRINR